MEDDWSKGNEENRFTLHLQCLQENKYPSAWYPHKESGDGLNVSRTKKQIYQGKMHEVQE